MHRLPSISAIRRMRLAAFLLLVKCLLVPASAVVLIRSISIGDSELVWIGIGMIALVMLMVLLQWLIAARANCPLCLTPVLATKDCSKHRDARKVIGSHRLHVALTVLFTNRFRCPYCGEPTILEVRHGRRR